MHAAMMKILLLPLGTTGDVLPFVWAGRRMRERGHSVTLVWVESCRQMAVQAGLDFEPIPDDGYEALVRDPGLWRPHQSLKVTHAFAGRCVPRCLQAVENVIARQGKPDLILATIMNFAALILRRKLSVPVISTILSLYQFVSSHQVPRSLPASGLLRLLPVVMRRFFLTHVAPYDHLALPQVRESCREHRVRPPRRLRDWWHSPDGSLALFPEWFAARQPDWPANTLQWDFPLEDMADARPLEPRLAAFLAAGGKPVVFTLGSQHLHSRDFFETSTRLAAQLGVRAVFATPHAGLVPPELPQSIFVTTYAPFSQLLPRAAAFVHHGGMGTLSQCFAAGIPQLIVPMAYDQPDNAALVRRLGAGLMLDHDQFTPERALPLLRRCLEDESIRHGARRCAERIRGRTAISVLTDWLEGRMHSPASMTA